MNHNESYSEVDPSENRFHPPGSRAEGAAAAPAMAGSAVAFEAAGEHGRAEAAQAPAEPTTASGRKLSPHWFATIVAIWSGQAVSIFTSYAASFAAVWYVTETTGSAFLLSVLSICAYLPQGLLSPYGGALADRFDRKKVIIVADMAVGLVSLLLAVLAFLGDASVPMVMVMVAMRSAAQAFHGPAMMAAMPMLVPEKHLLRINSLDMMLMSVAGMVSPALGMLLYSLVGFHSVLFLDFAGALVACAALVFVKIPRVERTGEPEKHHPLAEVHAGWRALRENHGLFLLIVFITLGMVTFAPTGALYPLMTYSRFAGDGLMASIAEGAFAAGMLAGSIVIMAWGGGKRLALLLSAACTSFGLVCAACGFLPPTAFGIFIGLCVAMGFICAFFNGPTLTLVQRNVPEEKMGRVLGFVTAFMGLASPAGVAVGGMVAEVTGVAPFFLIDGLLCAAVGIALYAPRAVRALDRPSGGAK